MHYGVLEHALRGPLGPKSPENQFPSIWGGETLGAEEACSAKNWVERVDSSLRSPEDVSLDLSLGLSTHFDHFFFEVNKVLTFRSWRSPDEIDGTTTDPNQINI